MSPQSTSVTASNTTLNLEQLLTAIRQLDMPARTQVARVLLETEWDAKLTALIQRLTERPPMDEISDEFINAEVHAVRRVKT
ncbi:MAG: hypothetical protein ILNGONEN_01042 [Syntrophorhabdaceae bacterium]|nr:hypothetical protein [Syntrophorhabdaceae bacterium]